MALALALLFDIVFQDPWRHTPTQVHHATPVYKGKGRDPLDWKSYRMIMVVSTLWKLYDMVITARMKVCARVDPSMSTASKGVDARHNLHLAVDLVALQSSRGACLLQGVQDMERGFPTCERADVSLAVRLIDHW